MKIRAHTWPQLVWVCPGHVFRLCTMCWVHIWPHWLALQVRADARLCVYACSVACTSCTCESTITHPGMCAQIARICCISERPRWPDCVQRRPTDTRPHCWAKGQSALLNWQQHQCSVRAGIGRWARHAAGLICVTVTGLICVSATSPGKGRACA